MRFGSDTSPWVAWQGPPIQIAFELRAEETTSLSGHNKCVFNQAYQQISVTSPESYNVTIDRAVMIKHIFDKGSSKVDQMIVYFDIPWFEFYFGLITGPDAVEYTCDVMRNQCGHKEIWEYNDWTTMADCKAAMMDLPIFSDTEIRYIDGLTRSCRQLHVAFATINDNHCEHLSIKKLKDVNGKYKCQESQLLNPNDFFNDADLAFWEQFKAKVGLEYGTFSEPNPRIQCPNNDDSDCPAFHHCTSDGCVFGERPPITSEYVQDCLVKFNALNFNVYDYNRYPEFFHDDSSVTLSQAGDERSARP